MLIGVKGIAGPDLELRSVDFVAVGDVQALEDWLMSMMFNPYEERVQTLFPKTAIGSGPFGNLSGRALMFQALLS